VVSEMIFQHDTFW